MQLAMAANGQSVLWEVWQKAEKQLLRSTLPNLLFSKRSSSCC